MSKFVIKEKVRYSYHSEGYKKIFDIVKIDSIKITSKGIFYNVMDIETGEFFDEVKERDLWKVKREYSKEMQSKLDSIKRKKKRSQITKSEVLWIFALKDGYQKEHYNLHYGRYDDQPTEHTIVAITADILEKTNSWNEAIRCLRMDANLYSMMRKKTDMPLHEWLFIAIRNWCVHRDIYWMTEYAPNEWQVWTDEAREEWHNEREANK